MSKKPACVSGGLRMSENLFELLAAKENDGEVAFIHHFRGHVP